MNPYAPRRSLASTIASAVFALSASCLTLGSVVLLFGTAADQPGRSAAVTEIRTAPV